MRHQPAMPTTCDPDPVHQASKADRGATLVEYALLMALIAVVCIGAVNYFGGATETSFETSTDSMVDAGF